MRWIAAFLLASPALSAPGEPAAWLVRMQRESGAWTRDGEERADTTALCVLALLGNGYTDRGGIKANRYAGNVRRALRTLVRDRGDTPYAKAVVALALCDALWTTKNPAYREPARESIDALEESDDPVARAFTVAALRAARLAGLPVPDARFDRERAWFDAVPGRYPAAELYARALMPGVDPRRSPEIHRLVKQLSREEPDGPREIYLRTLALFRLGGRAWKGWNETVLRGVVRTQLRGGSWNEAVEDTAYGVLCLAVYYRYDRVFGLKREAPESNASLRGRSVLPPLSARLRTARGKEIPLEHLAAEMRTAGFRARVRLSFTFFHDGDARDEGTFQLRLPDGASPHQLAFGGARAPAESAEAAWTGSPEIELKRARMVERERAHRAYTTITSEQRDPALLEWDGDGVFSVRVFPLEPKRLHEIELGYDVDLPYTLALPATRREAEVRVNGESFEGAAQREFPAAPAAAWVLAGGGYTAARVPSANVEGWTIGAARIAGCIDVLVNGRTIAARGEAAAGARLELELRRGAETRAWSTAIPAPVDSDLAARVYGEIAVARLEPLSFIGGGVPEAYARHFRVVRATCSLVMLESEGDYARFGILARDDAAAVRSTPVVPWLAERESATTRERARWHLETIGKPVDLLEHVPDAELEGWAVTKAPPADSDDALARRPRLALALDRFQDAGERELACARVLATGCEGYWLDHVRTALKIDGCALSVVMYAEAAGGDVDLHVVDPLGDVCNWRRPHASTGGRLEADQPGGGRPEIYRMQVAEPGEYVVRANYFRPAGRTRVHVVALAGDRCVRGTVELEHRDQMVEALRISLPEPATAR